jgi:hypothetical protein
LNERAQCPVCNTVVGIIVGSQPQGRMLITKQSTILPGHESDSKGSIVITFDLPDGRQGSHHPHPGVPYEGTTRRAWYVYLVSIDNSYIHASSLLTRLYLVNLYAMLYVYLYLGSLIVNVVDWYVI